MKTTVVPAQVTTVEDRVAGSLGLSQLLLLTTPVFTSSLLYVILPPSFHSAPYKIFIILSLFLLCGLLAIRIKGKIVLFWAVILLRYQLRPHYYVFNKHTLFGRKQYAGIQTTDDQRETEKPQVTHRAFSLTEAEIFKLRELMQNPAANVSFETRKGGLYVRITELKQEG